MSCELVALACLVAHGDITNTRYFQRDAYKPDDIFRRLERLHPEFYPIPVTPTFNIGTVNIEPIESGFLTKKELIRLYGKCGEILHKGSLQRLTSSNQTRRLDFLDINEGGQKTLNLLNVHRISRLGNRFHFIVALVAPQVGGNVLVSIAESPPETPRAPS
jgi:hypothetical protein